MKNISKMRKRKHSGKQKERKNGGKKREKEERRKTGERGREREAVGREIQNIEDVEDRKTKLALSWVMSTPLFLQSRNH